MIGDSDPHRPVPSGAPPIARVYGVLVVLLGVWATQVMSGSVWRAVQQGGGIGLYVLPGAIVALTPGVAIVYLGVRIMRGERLAVYALGVVMVLVGAVIMLLDMRRGGYLIGASVLAFAPLCRAAMKESGGFH